MSYLNHKEQQKWRRREVLGGLFGVFAGAAVMNRVSLDRADERRETYKRDNQKPENYEADLQTAHWVETSFGALAGGVAGFGIPQGLKSQGRRTDIIYPLDYQSPIEKIEAAINKTGRSLAQTIRNRRPTEGSENVSLNNDNPPEL